MKYAYFDASSGVSGDMTLGALLDLGADTVLFQDQIASLNLPVEIKVKETQRASLRALKVDVSVNRTDHQSRKWADIEHIIQKSSFSDTVKQRASLIFKSLFQAEAKVHGRDFSSTHLHEAGADDAIVDILGTCLLAEQLNINEFYSSPLNLGSGFARSAHGTYPVPPPAVAELLKDIPVYSEHIQKELVTPTGAAIISSIVTDFNLFPELMYEKVGCGAGGRDFKRFPNILRIFYGETDAYSPKQRIYQIEVNIDDSNPQILAAFLDKALEKGALDVFMTPVVMKKNRMATKLTLLAEFNKIVPLTALVFEETSSIGLRYFPVRREILKRKRINVTVMNETISVKVAEFQGKPINFQPEFADCKKVADKKNLPLKKVMELAIKELNTGKKE
ncbi:MAG: nickel pincer cofactor biosynthesis protein LarC [Candidatus Aminicenantes bacterium]|nr:nickel pincer cofactor biosynthesis protein LarC [Candidatus Aminicenantes bacterium]